MKLKIELSEEQLQMIINALEVNFRIMMGQGDIAADLLAVIPDKDSFAYEQSWNRAFDQYLMSRDVTGMMLNNCAQILYGHSKLPENAHRLSDMWSVLRHVQYSMQPTDEYDVRRWEPFQTSDWDLIKVEVMK